MPSLARLVFSLCAGAALSACGGQLDTRVASTDPPAPTALASTGAATAISEDGELVVSPFYIAGEAMEMAITFANIQVATLQVAVGDLGRVDGRRAVVVRSLTRSDGILAVVKKLREEAITTLDVDAGQPLRSAGSFIGLFTHAESATPVGEQAPWSHEGGHNTHSAMGMLRAWRAPAGSRAHFDLVVAGSRSRVEVFAAGRESIRGDNGVEPARRIEGQVLGAGKGGAPRQFIVWVSDDANRKLLRVDAETEYGGILRAKLTFYQRP